VLTSKEFLVHGVRCEGASISDGVKALDAYWQSLKQENRRSWIARHSGTTTTKFQQELATLTVDGAQWSFDPELFNIKVIASAARTDHRAIVATAEKRVYDRSKRAEKRSYRRRTPEQHANTLHQLSNFDDSRLLNITDPQRAWDALYDVLLAWLDAYYPLRVVTVTTREPDFMTPEIKTLLRRKNRLMRRGRLEEASAIALKVGKAIARQNGRRLRSLNSSKGTKQLWECVNRLTKDNQHHNPNNLLTANQLNDHYAGISTDTAYLPPPYKLSAHPNTSVTTTTCAPEPMRSRSLWKTIVISFRDSCLETYIN